MLSQLDILCCGSFWTIGTFYQTVLAWFQTSKFEACGQTIDMRIANLESVKTLQIRSISRDNWSTETVQS